MWIIFSFSLLLLCSGPQQKTTTAPPMMVIVEQNNKIKVFKKGRMDGWWKRGLRIRKMKWQQSSIGSRLVFRPLPLLILPVVLLVALLLLWLLLYHHIIHTCSRFISSLELISLIVGCFWVLCPFCHVHFRYACNCVKCNVVAVT